MIPTYWKRRAGVALVAASLQAPAFANEQQALQELRDTTMSLIESLVESGVLTREKADAIIKQSKDKAAAAAAVAAKKPAPAVAGAAPLLGPDGRPVVRVPYVPESVKAEIREQVKQEVVAQAKAERWGEPAALPEWLDRIKWEGDIRLRYQRNTFGSGNAPAAVFQAAGQNVTNTSQDQDLFRLRARLGMMAQITPTLGAAFRLTTGNANDPVSTNQTLGTYNNKYYFALDRAYVRYTPWDWAKADGGKVPNPWFGTDLLWNENLNFEGFTATAQRPALPGADFRPFGTVAYLPLQQFELSGGDKSLLGVQAGFEWDINPRTRTKVGLGYYDFRNIYGIPNTNPANPNFYDYTAAPFRQKGNSVFNISGVPGVTLFGLTSEFKVANLTGTLDFSHFDPAHVIFVGDYARNTGFSTGEIFQRTGLILSDSKQTDAWSLRGQVGMPSLRARHDWQAFVTYKYLEANAVVDAFNDSDFHLGGTNAKGFIVGGSYGLDRNVWLTMRYLSSTQVNGPPLAIDTLQFDFNARF